MKELKLTIKKNWFAKIESGEKTEEYREINEYWLWRLFWNNGECEGSDEILADMRDPLRRHDSVQELIEYFGLQPKEYDVLHFYNGGYFSDTYPNLIVDYLGLDINKGKPEWGAEEGKYYFVLKLKK